MCFLTTLIHASKLSSPLQSTIQHCLIMIVIMPFHHKQSCIYSLRLRLTVVAAQNSLTFAHKTIQFPHISWTFTKANFTLWIIRVTNHWLVAFNFRLLFYFLIAPLYLCPNFTKVKLFFNVHLEFDFSIPTLCLGFAIFNFRLFAMPRAATIKLHQY